MLERIKNPIFLAALASLIYQILSHYIQIDPAMYGNIVNLITFLLIGGGVWSTFGSSKSQIPMEIPAVPEVQIPEMKFAQPLDDVTLDQFDVNGMQELSNSKLE